MKLRKLMALAIIATIALLSSCSSDSSDTSDGSDNGTTDNGSEAAGDSSWDDIVTAAQEEGRVVVYSSATTAQITRIEEAFESEHDGIDVEIVSLTSGEQVNRLMQEFDTNQVGADIAWNAQPNFFREIDGEGKLEAPVGPADENFPDDYRLNDGARLLYALPIPIIWNTNQVPDGVDNYDDRTNPAFQGRLALADTGVPSRFWQAQVFGD